MLGIPVYVWIAVRKCAYDLKELSDSASSVVGSVSECRLSPKFICALQVNGC